MKRFVGAIVVIVIDVFATKSTQVPFIERNDVIQHLAATASHPSFRHSVLPRTPHARAEWLDTAVSKELPDVLIEFRIPVEHDKTLRRGQGESFPKLLDDPFTGRMRGGIEVQDATATMLDHEEAIEDSEVQSRHCEEIQAGNHFSMVVQKSEPALRLLGMSV